MSVTCLMVALLASCCLWTAPAEGGVPLQRALKSRAPFCSRMCGGGSGRYADEMFEPYRCSCSPSCAVFGDCCYDSPYRVKELWQQHEFVCISVTGLNGYQAVSSCPPGTYPDYCQGYLGILRPVTSSETNITYANRYCARCNDDANDLTVWNVYLSCPSTTDDAIYGRYNRIVYSSPDFWMTNAVRQTKRLCKFRVLHGDFRTLEELELRPCVTVNKYSRCSPSWKNPATAKMCSSYEDPVFLDNTAFRNPHCAHCNYVNLSYVECVPHHLKTTLRWSIVHDDVIRYCLGHYCHLELGNGPPYAFSSIFNGFHREKSCPKGERYNPNTRRCRPLSRRKNYLASYH